jgi:hypothetical protein
MNNKMAKLQERRRDNETYIGFSSTEDSIMSSVFREALLKNELRKSIESTGFSENEYWVYESMKEVGDKYRNKSYTEAKKIEKTLRENEVNNIDIDFQGSVTNNTCIRYVSDIDLLVVTQDFFSLEPPLKPEYPYNGNPLKDLKILRARCIDILKHTFKSSAIDTTKSKCISISGGSLQRDVDVVICNWYHTVNYHTTMEEFQKGIKVLDVTENARVLNLPFLHNNLLDKKDVETKGKYKQFVRLIKSIKSDADDNIDISSYEITALLYHMNNTRILGLTNPHDILSGINSHFIYLCNHRDELSKLYVPNKTVKIIDSLNMNAFVSLINEIKELTEEL